jgi:hypothetical protein
MMAELCLCIYPRVISSSLQAGEICLFEPNFIHTGVYIAYGCDISTLILGSEEALKGLGI